MAASAGNRLRCVPILRVVALWKLKAHPYGPAGSLAASYACRTGLAMRAGSGTLCAAGITATVAAPWPSKQLFPAALNGVPAVAQAGHSALRAYGTSATLPVLASHCIIDILHSHLRACMHAG